MEARYRGVAGAGSEGSDSVGGGRRACTLRAGALLAHPDATSAPALAADAPSNKTRSTPQLVAQCDARGRNNT